MPSFPPITIRQPQPYDLVDAPLLVCGIASGFGGGVSARVLDSNGVELATATIPVGAPGVRSNFQLELALGAIPATSQGTLEVFDHAPSDGSRINTIVIPIVFGRVLIDPYHGFTQHVVVRGDTLALIAKRIYGSAGTWPRIFAANRQQLSNPTALVPGQVLRVPQGEPRRNNQGLQFGAVIDDKGHIKITDRDWDALARSGAGWLKINFRLGGFQNWTETTTFGYSALSLYDQIIAKAISRGLRVTGLLSNEAWHGGLAQWQANNAELAGGGGDNSYLTQFAQAAAVPLAQHYAQQITMWEIWNEPSQALTYLHPSNFAWLLAHVYAEVKAKVPTAHIISGGITAEQDRTGALTVKSVGADYLTQTYAQGIRRAGWNTIKTTYASYPLDTIGQHVYIDAFTPTTAEHIARALQLLRTAYVAAEGGTTAKKTIITEFGWTSGAVSASVQAANLRIAYGQISATSYVQQAYWFFLRDEPGAKLLFGLIGPDGAPKPAWDAYTEYANF